jgi:hypothetical protein
MKKPDEATRCGVDGRSVFSESRVATVSEPKMQKPFKNFEVADKDLLRVSGGISQPCKEGVTYMEQHASHAFFRRRAAICLRRFGVA